MKTISNERIYKEFKDAMKRACNNGFVSEMTPLGISEAQKDAHCIKLWAALVLFDTEGRQFLKNTHRISPYVTLAKLFCACNAMSEWPPNDPNFRFEDGYLQHFDGITWGDATPLQAINLLRTYLPQGTLAFNDGRGRKPSNGSFNGQLKKALMANDVPEYRRLWREYRKARKQQTQEVL